MDQWRSMKLFQPSPKQNTASVRRFDLSQFALPAQPCSSQISCRPQSAADDLAQSRQFAHPFRSTNAPELTCTQPASRRIRADCSQTLLHARAPQAMRKVTHWKPYPELRPRQSSSTETSVAALASRPTSPVLASPVPCTPDSSPTASPALPTQRKASRPVSPAPTRYTE